ncbi:MAG: NAD-dependent epimerase/dehydratase family protein, partial [Candidatus Limnocylindria bacterium]
MNLANKGYDVSVVDSFHRRLWDDEIGSGSLTPIKSLRERVRTWNKVGDRSIEMFVGDICDWDFLAGVFKETQPEAIVHYGEHRAAPFSMLSRRHAVMTQVNNVMGTLN